MSFPAAPPPASSRLVIFDTTLRDGEQSPGVSLNAEAKLRIGRALAELGVDVCEIGFPACAVDLASIRSLVSELGHYTPATRPTLDNQSAPHPMTLAVLARCVKSDIDLAWEVVRQASKPRIHVFYATSDIHLQYKLKKTQAEALVTIQEMVTYARSLCADIEWSAEDASRTSVDFLAQACITAINAGATTINLPDTVGSALPHQYLTFIAEVRARVFASVAPSVFHQITFSTHCHNDLGMATSNSIAALTAGCRQVECTINGIGERAGNTAMEEVVMAVHLHPNSFSTVAPLVHHIQTRLIVPTSELVASLSGMAVQRNKAIVGRNCCLHESGVHVDGILKNRSTYEIFPAELVGWGLTNNGVVLGKHSGRAAYKGKLAELGVVMDNEEQLQQSFLRFQTLVANQQGEVALTPEQLLSTVHNAPLKPIPVVSSKPIEESKEQPTGSADLIIELLGDGINDEVTTEGRRVLDAVAAVTGRQFVFEQHPIGGRAIDLTGNPLPPSTLAACQRSKAVLLGAVGDPRFNDPNLKVRPEQGLLAIRSGMQLFNNLRPVVVYPSLIDACPFKREVVEGTDVMIVRELTGGIYLNAHNEGTEKASDVMEYSVQEIERIVRAAADLARGRKKRLVSLDKANVLACSRLWRNTVTRIMKAEYPDVAYEHMLIDSAAMHLMKNPRYFDVIVTENLFGDILSDEAAALASSLGMMGSASLSYPGKPGLYEPVHGSAPDIAGKGIANPIGTILSVAMMLRYSLGLPEAAKAVEKAIADVVESGLVTPDIAKKGVTAATTQQVGKAIAERTAQLLRSATGLSAQPSASGRRPMTLPEKILCHQAVGLTQPEVVPGEWIVCKVARTLASEMTWLGMSETWAAMGQPPLWRKDRFFLAIDHTVDPVNYANPFQSKLISEAEGFAKSVQLVDYFAPNQSILHTEFYRQRALPGTVICGADSHSCSAGCLGAFAAGLGAADVVMPTVTGQTFMQVPETLLINFQNDLPFGMTGKDVMLYVMSKLKRNTVAFERVVEFNGSIRSMSIDSRFALANMTTEFGGIAGIFPADEVTAAFLTGRKKDRKSNKDDQQASRQHATVELDDGEEGEPLYFQADSNAQYADRYDIDLATVVPLIAKYPSPDNVFPLDHPEIDAVVPEVGRSIRKLDGCFIGACTTTEEEIILAALVLEEALNAGVKPVAGGTRKVTAGSAIMTRKLQRLGLLDIYKRAGFTVGSPGCSYCLAEDMEVLTDRGFMSRSEVFAACPELAVPLADGTHEDYRNLPYVGVVSATKASPLYWEPTPAEVAADAADGIRHVVVKGGKAAVHLRDARGRYGRQCGICGPAHRMWSTTQQNASSMLSRHNIKYHAAELAALNATRAGGRTVVAPAAAPPLLVRPASLSVGSRTSVDEEEQPCTPSSTSTTRRMSFSSNDGQDDAVCMVCDSSDDADDMLLCDGIHGCLRGCHLGCSGLNRKPEGAWCCSTCRPPRGLSSVGDDFPLDLLSQPRPLVPLVCSGEWVARHASAPAASAAVQPMDEQLLVDAVRPSRSPAASSPLLFASLNPSTGHMEYLPATALVYKTVTSLVEFTNAAEAPHWAADADEYGRTPDQVERMNAQSERARLGERLAEDEKFSAENVSNGVSLLVDPHHDMFVRLGLTTAEDRPSHVTWASESFMKVKAGSLLTGDVCQRVRMTGQAAEGLLVGADELPFASVLGLTTEKQVDAFLELYGYWCGDGSLGVTRNSVTFAPKKEGDKLWLKERLDTLGLTVRSGSLQHTDVDHANGQRCFTVKEPRWASYFFGEYGHKHGVAPSAASAAAAAVTHTGRTTYDIKSVKWFWMWVWRLRKERARRVLAGLRFADGSEAADVSEIYTSGHAFRDEIVRLALHAGYAVRFRLMYKKGDHRGYDAGGTAFIANHDSWAVTYNDHVFSAEPILYNHRDIQRLDRPATVPVWCVTVPPHNLIFARRATRNAKGVVTHASKPIVVGNCLGVAADVAPKGSVWLSSQNRNFRNRMGPGSIGNLASASTVAVSSLFMEITDPRPYLAKVDKQRYEQMLEREPLPASVPRHEPNPDIVEEDTAAEQTVAQQAVTVSSVDRPSYLPSHISGRIQRFEDNIDTDAIIPAQHMLDRPLSKLAKQSFKHVRPEFVDRVAEGRTIVVAGIGFGCGSSREEAVSCLRALGIKAVIAKGYSFIYSRNLLTLDLLGIIIADDEFYSLAQENEQLDIDVDNETVTVAGKSFPFSLSPIQKQIYRQGGVIQMYRESGPQLFKQLADVAKQGAAGGCGTGGKASSCGPTVDAAHADLAERPTAVPSTAQKTTQW